MYVATSVTTFPCTAHVTINRNRAKIYGDSIYLKDRQTFEIELFNPSKINVLAKIDINGNPISSSGIILRPGQRVYLERFIDSNNKFVFETYEIDKNDKEALRATENNGLVRVLFYDEFIPGPSYFPNTIPSYPYYYYDNSGRTNSPYYYGGTFTTSGLSGSLANSLSSNAFCSTFNIDDNITYTSTSDISASFKDTKRSLEKSLETGRIEKGEASQQSFVTANGDFSPIPSNSITYRLKPESQRPVEVSKIRTYCPECGIRIKKPTWKFCPECGENLK